MGWAGQKVYLTGQARKGQKGAEAAQGSAQAKRIKAWKRIRTRKMRTLIGWIGLDWVGLGQRCLGWAGLGWVGMEGN